MPILRMYAATENGVGWRGYKVVAARTELLN